MTFHDVLFPKKISYGAQGGPRVDVIVIATASGYEQRAVNSEIITREWSISKQKLNKNQMEELNTFFINRYGRLYSFRYFDWFDYRATNQEIGTATAGQTQFQLKKFYAADGYSYERKITKPINAATYTDANAISISVDGSEQTEGADYNVDYSTGIVTFTSGLSAGQVVTASFDFHVHARFNNDQFDVNYRTYNMFDWTNVIIKEIKEE